MEIVESACFGPLPSTERGLGFHLDATEKGKQPPRIIYGNQNMVIVRELKDMNKCVYFQGHPAKVNVAKFHPNGGWVASGDDSGYFMVWSSLTQVPKQDGNCGKSIYDIDWDGEGKRIIMGGKGKKEKVKIVPWNTNNSLGQLSGISGNVLSVAFRPKRKYHVVAVAEDPVVVFSTKGPPFAFGSCDKTHKGYINCVRYHPSGDFFMTVGKDKQILVFEGETGKLIRDIKDKQGHKGTIYSFSFNEDGSRFVTCAADKSIKMWDFENGKVLRTFHPHDGKLELEDMQVACTWTGSSLISVSLSGQINFFDDSAEEEKSNTPKMVIAGHQKTITCLELDDKAGLVYTACNGGRIVQTNVKTGERKFFYRDANDFKKVLTLAMRELALSPDGEILACIYISGMVYFSPTRTLTMDPTTGFLLDGAPKCCAYSKTTHLMVVGTHKNKIFVFKDGKHDNTIDTERVPRAIDISHDDKKLLVGGDNGSLYLYDLDDSKSDPVVLESEILKYVPVRVKFNKNSELIVTVDEHQSIWIWNTSDAGGSNVKPKNSSFRGYHSASIFDCDWNENDALVTVGLDGTIIVWPNACKGKSEGFFKLVNAHQGGISRVRFLPEGKQLLTCSHDASMRLFDIQEKKKDEKLF